MCIDLISKKGILHIRDLNLEALVKPVNDFKRLRVKMVMSNK